MMPPRGARLESRFTEGHRRERCSRDSVDVLARGDRLERCPLVDLRRHGMLQQDVVVEYALRGFETPLAVSTYTTHRALPEEVRLS